ncbi:hypothetical protein BGZ65_012092, partial [Modicella reniformis]
MRKTDPSKYSQRKLIGEEFEHLGRNEGNMRDCHGGALDKIGDLITSIRVKNAERKAQKSGIKRPRATRTGGKKRSKKSEDEEEDEGEVEEDVEEEVEEDEEVEEEDEEEVEEEDEEEVEEEEVEEEDEEELKEVEKL